MGAVKLETRSQGRGVREWDNVTLNSIDTIDILIRFRAKFDKSYYSKCYYSTDIFESNGVPEFLEIITCLYVDLDKYIERSEFNDYEKDIVKYLMLGYQFEDIISLVNKRYMTNKSIGEIKRNFRRSICRKILNEYRYDYEEWLHLSEMVKISKDDKYKQCGMCKKHILLNSDNFPKRSDSKDGYDYYCRQCKTVVAYRSKSAKKNLYVLRF